jgi:glucose-6-phosphate 1-dehydrogenase
VTDRDAIADEPLLRSPDPCAIVIFGALGDLARRKLFPALYELSLRGLMPERFHIVGTDVSELSAADFLLQMESAVGEHARTPLDKAAWERFAANVTYVPVSGGLDRVEENVADADRALELEGNRLYYLAVPPKVMEGIVDELGKRRQDASGFVRLVIEKPFGTSRESARHLTEKISRYYTEKEIFRIDHFLGRATVENISVLRFANGIFEPLWNRDHIDNVQITVAESIGIEGRASFYEEAGALKDIFQNHLLQLATLVAMEPPIDLQADSVRNEKLKVLRAMHTPSPKNVVRGQYGAGLVDGTRVRGYREEPGVAGDSMTETFFAAKLYIDNWRWAGVPFFVRTGKRLPRKDTSIAIQFKPVPHPIFGGSTKRLDPNVLLIGIQPNEGAELMINAKVPGQGLSVSPVKMDFNYDADMPEAYERLILEAMLGDATLFTRADEVEEQWSLVDAITPSWTRREPDFPNYRAGSWGPAEADDLLARDGRTWTVS